MESNVMASLSPSVCECMCVFVLAAQMEEHPLCSHHTWIAYELHQSVSCKHIADWSSLVRYLLSDMLGVFFVVVFLHFHSSQKQCPCKTCWKTQVSWGIQLSIVSVLDRSGITMCLHTKRFRFKTRGKKHHYLCWINLNLCSWYTLVLYLHSSFLLLYYLFICEELGAYFSIHYFKLAFLMTFFLFKTSVLIFEGFILFWRCLHKYALLIAGS